ncbi:uncharacterized protein LOC135335369 isoform X2 [Halichondria panicea]|uniref:uncharacterized protein LOC135335369 isoform X2 n=1 Tax=Halichondria panicea TaxID=6063 RepID=UPI00312BABA0
MFAAAAILLGIAAFGVHCQGKVCSVGDIRRANGTDFSGRVEVCFNNTWGTVCDDGWDLTDANVACRQLGYHTARDGLSVDYSGQVTGDIFLDNLNCVGNETRLIDCPHNGVGVHNCDHSEDAGVVCQNEVCSDGDIRLADGSKAFNGRVEVCHNNAWGTVCDDGWDLSDAYVVCRQLGYRSALDALVPAYFGQGNGDILLDDLECAGNETKLIDCPHDGVGVHNCHHSEDIGVVCEIWCPLLTSHINSTVSHSSLSLWSVATYSCDGSSRTCQIDRSWNGPVPACAGEPVCAILPNPSNGVLQYNDTVLIETTQVMYSCEVNYTLSGDSTRTCGSVGTWGGSAPTCQVCTQDGAVRLVGGNSTHNGRVEVCSTSLNTWGTVCDDFWDINDAIVVCRQMGYRTALNAVRLAYYGQGNGEILLDNLACAGNETRLIDCPHSGVGVHNCHHNEDAGVVCDGAVLCPSLHSHINSTVSHSTTFWGSVATYSCDGSKRTCLSDGSWNGSVPTCAGEPVCAALPSPSNGVLRYNGTTLVERTQAMYHCEVNYTLSGDSTRTCRGDGTWSGSAPTCQVCVQDGAVRLVGGNNTYSGRVEVYSTRFNTWGTVCDDSWGLIEANTACQQLGYLIALDASHLEYFGQGQGTGYILFDNLQCVGNESRLIDCAHIIGLESNNCGHLDIVGVVCEREPVCAALPDLFNGVLIYNDTVLVESTQVMYSCESSYTLNGDSTRICRSNGTWSGAASICQGLPGPINHTLITSSLISLNTVEVMFIILADNNIPITGYRYILCRNHCTNTTVNTMPTGSNMLRFTIRQLIPNSRYILRVYAVNELGEGPIPDEDPDAHIFNSATKADGKPANLMVAFSTETRLVLSWTLPALATHPDVTVTNFRISWGKTGDPSSSYLLPFSSSTPQQRFTIPSTLEPATRYTIEVIAYYSVPLLISDHAVINGTTVSVGQVTITCLPGRDSIWDVEWPETGRNVTVQGICPNQLGTDVSGQAARYCNSNGVWADPDVLQCKNMEFVSILEQVTSTSSEELVEQAANLTMQLAAITQPNAISLLPSSLNATNQVLSLVISALKEESTTTDANELIVDVLNNVLEINNSQGWNDLQSTDAGSQVLLDNAERLGVLLARSQNANGTIEPVRVSRPNIAISSSLINISKDITKDITFPQIEDLVNYTNSSTLVPAAIRISSALLADRLDEQKNTAIPTVFILFQNLGSFLPTPTDGLSNTTQGASVVISSQVGERGNGRPSQTLQQSPLSLNFTFNEVENPENYRCVFWNFSEPVGNGGWISDGVSTINNATEGSTTTVQCSSTHLTSFAVLVDLGGPKNSSLVERKILDVVSYAGCSISVVCLIVAVIFFLAQGKQLFNKVHYFVHLNFSISLLLAFLVFIVGIDTAVGNRVGCAFVTALLHYLFLAVFCWMLCEGVMLYLLLVAVFSAVTRKWWFFLMLGYLLPLPFVLVTVAVRWRYYGIAETEQSEFCWLTTRDGTIFGFVAPMLAVIVINIVFLVFILKSLWKNKKSAAKRMEKEESNFELVKSLLQGVVVLQPLLGLTWAFGLLTLVRNTSAFVWIFTILNSLQGVAVLFFHVIRNDQVKQKINYWCMKLFRPSTISRYDTTGMSNLTSESLKDTSTLKSTLPSGITLPLSEHSEQSQYSQLPITETKMELANEADDVMEAVADSLDTKVDLKHDSNATEDLSNLVDSKDDEKMDMIVDKTTTLTNKDV